VNVAPPIGQQHVSLADRACEVIRARILSGEYAAGAKLAEAALAEQLGVSRLPVREALRRLADEGFVALAPRRSAYVWSPSVEDFLEIYDVRAALEPLCQRLAVEHRTDGDLERLEAIVRAGEEALPSEDWALLAQLNQEFHQAVVEAGGNRHLIQVTDGYRVRLDWMRRATRPAMIASTSAKWSDHRAILEAIRNRDADDAVALAEEHARTSRAEFASWMEGQGP
jgi:DNA-binding GntR family transcriptional regulator